MVFLKTFQGIATFTYQSDAQTLSWLKRIMVNECLQYLRSNHSFLQLSEDCEVTTDEKDALAKLSADEIYHLILELPVGYRTVFNLYVVEGLTHKEIAGLLRISEGTSKSQLSKSRAMLQQMITEQHAYEARNIR